MEARPDWCRRGRMMSSDRRDPVLQAIDRHFASLMPLVLPRPSGVGESEAFIDLDVEQSPVAS